MGSALLKELEETLLTAGFSFRLQKMFFVCILGIKISRWLQETLMCSFLIMNRDFFSLSCHSCWKKKNNPEIISPRIL